MTILFMYDSPLIPEKGGTERATKLVMDELARRGHTTIGLLHFNQTHPDEYFLNGERIPSLVDFLNANHVDVVVNQIAFHYWLLKEFLAHGGQEWKDKGGKIVSFMHFDPPLRPLTYHGRFKGMKQLPLVRKIKRLGLVFYVPYLYLQYVKTRRFSYRYIYDKSDAYILLSKSFIPTFMKVGKIQDTSKIKVIPNMLTFPEIESEDILQHKSKTVLIVSRMSEYQKRISTAIKIWNKVPHYGYTLKIVGTGESLQDYKEWVSKHKVQDIEFLGQQPPLKYYKEAAIFMMTSMFEGWGLTLTESLQNGVVPIVMNTTTVFSDIIQDGKTGYLANSEKEYALRLKELLFDDNLRKRMAAQGLHSAKQFSQNTIVDKWIELLNNITNIRLL